MKLARGVTKAFSALKRDIKEFFNLIEKISK
jgi:hypothetical protein